MKSFRLEGDIIPVSWYENIRKGKNKPDLEACLILANILYWYRPTEIRDEISERVVEYKQKFKGDKLQKSYQQYADFLGIPKSSVKRAIDNLVKLKLITREFRNIDTKDGIRLINVMYLEPILEEISTISYRITPIPPQEKLGEVYEKNLDTYTKITPEITTKTDYTICAPITKTNTKTGSNADIAKVYDHWISQNIYQHRSNTFESQIRTALKKYSLEEIFTAITNYGIIVRGEEYYWNYKWTLGDFLKRGIDKFMDLDIAKDNYRINKKYQKNQQNADKKYGIV